MPENIFAPPADFDRQRTQFVVGEDDFTDLEFNPKDDYSGFHWFFDKRRNRLIKEFVLERTPQTLAYCGVTLIAKGDTFEPRLHLKRDNWTQAGWERGKEAIESEENNILVKASMNLHGPHDNFWRLVTFLTSFDNVSVPGERLSLVVAAKQTAGLVDLMNREGKPRVLEVVKAAVGGELTEADVRLLVDRKAALDEFERLLEDNGYIDQVVEHTGANGEEKVWQTFFEKHPWIFGYGLKLIAAGGLVGKLEQVTRASTAFNHGGDRVDGLMRTKGLIQSLMFVEIKRASTDLLPRGAYRTGSYPPSAELSGAVAQVQATTHQAIKQLGRSPVVRPVGADGLEQDVVGTVRPRQVVVVGTLDQLREGGRINLHRFRSFELYRRSINEVEIITFDELLERARFIARHDDEVGVDKSGIDAAPSPPPSEDEVPF